MKGLAKNQIVENLVAPLRSPIEFDEAFEKLRTECWYLHRRENDAWVFSRNENLRKKIEKYADGARGNPKIDAEMRRRLNEVFEPRKRIAYTQVLSLPKIEEIKPNSGRVLLVLSPDRKIPPEDAKRLFAAVPQKNNFCVVTGDGTDMGNLEEKVRRIWAVVRLRPSAYLDRPGSVRRLISSAFASASEVQALLAHCQAMDVIYRPSMLRGPSAAPPTPPETAATVRPTAISPVAVHSRLLRRGRAPAASAAARAQRMSR